MEPEELAVFIRAITAIWAGALLVLLLFGERVSDDAALGLAMTNYGAGLTLIAYALARMVEDNL